MEKIIGHSNSNSKVMGHTKESQRRWGRWGTQPYPLSRCPIVPVTQCIGDLVCQCPSIPLSLGVQTKRTKRWGRMKRKHCPGVSVSWYPSTIFGTDRRTEVHIQGVPKKIMLNISATKYRIFKPFFSLENWDPYSRVEYSNFFERFFGAEIFAKQNGILD